MLKISRVPFGVLAANSRVPSGDMASGRTWPLSNSRKEGPLEAADTLLSESWKLTRANALMSIHSARTHALAFLCDLRMVRGSFHGLMFRPFWAGSGRPARPEHETGHRVYHNNTVSIILLNDQLVIFGDFSSTQDEARSGDWPAAKSRSGRNEGSGPAKPVSQDDDGRVKMPGRTRSITRETTNR